MHSPHPKSSEGKASDVRVGGRVGILKVLPYLHNMLGVGSPGTTQEKNRNLKDLNSHKTREDLPLSVLDFHDL